MACFNQIRGRSPSEQGHRDPVFTLVRSRQCATLLFPYQPLDRDIADPLERRTELGPGLWSGGFLVARREPLWLGSAERRS
jgi:hypothetical protein